MGTSIQLAASTPLYLKVGDEPSSPPAGRAVLYMTEEGVANLTVWVKFDNGATSIIANDGDL